MDVAGCNSLHFLDKIDFSSAIWSPNRDALLKWCKTRVNYEVEVRHKLLKQKRKRASGLSYPVVHPFQQVECVLDRNTERLCHHDLSK